MRLNSNFQCYFGIIPWPLRPSQQKHLHVYSSSRQPPENWRQFRTNSHFEHISKSLHSHFPGHQKIFQRTDTFSPVTFTMLRPRNSVHRWRSTLNAVLLIEFAPLAVSCRPFANHSSKYLSRRIQDSQSALGSDIRRPSWVFCLHSKSSAEETMSLNNAFDNGPSTLEGRSQSRCVFPARRYSRSARVDTLDGSFKMLRYNTAIAATQFSDWMLEDVR